MVDTIGAAVRGNSDKSAARKLWRLGALHVTGAAATAALLGATLGGLGSLLGAPWGTPGVVAVAALAVVYLLREGLELPIPILQRRRQVPDWWRSFYSVPVAAFLYGAGLGVGFLTYLSYGTFVVVAGAALASGSPLVGALLCLPFGLARAVAAVVAGGRSELHDTIHQLEAAAEGSRPRLLNAAAIGLVLIGCLSLVL